MRVIVQKKWYNKNDCESTPNTIFVFGDNLIKHGQAGQAVIRNIENSYGIPTKALPAMTDKAFFNDDIPEHYNALVKSIITLNDTYKETNVTLIFPADGLGTGLSELKAYAPIINSVLSALLNKHFNIITDENGKLSSPKLYKPMMTTKDDQNDSITIVSEYLSYNIPIVKFRIGEKVFTLPRDTFYSKYREDIINERS